MLGESIKYSENYGWEGFDREKVHLNWEVLRENVQNHILSINSGYRRVNLKDHNVTYLNAFGTFIDNHTVQLEYPNKEVKQITARNIVIAVGGKKKKKKAGKKITQKKKNL